MSCDQLVAGVAPLPPRVRRVEFGTYLSVQIEDPALPVEQVEPLGRNVASRGRRAHLAESTREDLADHAGSFAAMEPAFLSAVDQARLVRAGEISSRELVTASLERIERLDPTLNSFVTVCADEALEAARTIDSTPGDAPFRGVPIGIKDLAATAGIRTTYSSRAYAEYVPDFDLAVVRRLLEAGFVIVGKTNTPEFGTVAFTSPSSTGRRGIRGTPS